MQEQRKPEDPALVTFSTRREAHPRRRAPRSLGITWMLVAIAGLLAFLGIVRAMTERASPTAGPSTQVPTEQVRINALSTDDDASVETTWQADPYLVLKCIGANGVPSYQSTPCTDRPAAAIYEATPDSAAAVARARRLERERNRQSDEVTRIASASGGAGIHRYNGSDARDQQRANCAEAKANRKRTLEVAGMARTYDLLQRLDRQVYEACKMLQPPD